MHTRSEKERYLTNSVYLGKMVCIFPGHDASFCGQLSQVAV